MKIDISDALSLEVQKHGERYYIEWGCIGSDDARLTRWVSFVRRRCPRKDRVGRYFDTRIDANRVIREFATKEKERAEREANRRRRAAGPVNGGLLQGVGQAASQQKGARKRAAAAPAGSTPLSAVTPRAAPRAPVRRKVR